MAPEDPNTGARTEPFRGPFEPPPGKPTVSDFVPSSPNSEDAPEPPAAERGPASEEKLEKIKDLYLTVEAIGDDNVGKHFDELMNRQRELISEYFKETGIGKGPRSTQNDQTQTDQPTGG